MKFTSAISMDVNDVLKLHIPVKSFIIEQKSRRKLCRILDRLLISRSWKFTRYLYAVVLNFGIFCSPRVVTLQLSVGSSILVILLFFKDSDSGDSFALYLAWFLNTLCLSTALINIYHLQLNNNKNQKNTVTFSYSKFVQYFIYYDNTIVLFIFHFSKYYYMQLLNIFPLK